MVTGTTPPRFVGLPLDHVTDHGFVIIDDYGVWDGCRKAVDEFLATRQLPITLTWTDDGEGVWFRKPAGNR